MVFASCGRECLKRGSILWKAGDNLSLILTMIVWLFLRMASNLGFTMGRIMLYWPGPSGFVAF